MMPVEIPAESKRLPGWEHRLAAAVEAARGRPFRWGRHDCATFAFDLRRDVAGGYDVAALWRSRYSTALGAARVMRRLGADFGKAGQRFRQVPDSHFSKSRTVWRRLVVALWLCFLGDDFGVFGPGQ